MIQSNTINYGNKLHLNKIDTVTEDKIEDGTYAISFNEKNYKQLLKSKTETTAKSYARKYLGIKNKRIDLFIYVNGKFKHVDFLRYKNHLIRSKWGN